VERTLILNAGSSSVKFRVYEDDAVVLDGMIDKLGTDATLELDGSRKIPITTHREAGLLIISLMPGKIQNVIHRVVHGGPYKRPMVMTKAVRAQLEKLVPLAPLHQPASLALIDLCAERLVARQIACFDTMFHWTLPKVARTYAIPQDLARKHGIVNYGFHGMAHEDMLTKALTFLGRTTPKGLRILTCQLGNGASLCAIKDGKSIDTTMGFTPLQGLMMGTRSGSIDPAIIEFLVENEHMTVEEVLDMLDERSGLLALGGSNDVRTLLRKESRGGERAKLALDVYAYHIRKRIGAYAAVMGGVDVLVLGGGVSKSLVMCRRILADLAHLGIAVTQRGPLVATGCVPILRVDVDEADRMYIQTRGM